MINWSSERAEELYNVKKWGEGHFGVQSDGLVHINTSLTEKPSSVSIHQVIENLVSSGHEMPVLLRIANTLDERIRYLHKSFQEAIERRGYLNQYKGVFPIKVNQQQHVVAHIAGFGKQFHHGLEVGSKAELIAAMSFLDDPMALLILNGYKDREFVDLGLYAQQIGMNVVFVLEMQSELDLILKQAQLIDVEPSFGVRMRLSTQTSGTWAQSSGDRSVFGLTASQVIEVVDQLKSQNKLHLLNMLHYHLGSQIPDINQIRSGVQEATLIYRDLAREGADMKILDLGGGLGVDYDGSLSNNPNSRNYTLEEYCDVIVYEIKSGLDNTGVAEPIIVTESGRATVAYSSVLIFNILDQHNHSELPKIPDLPSNKETIVRLRNINEALNTDNFHELYNEASFLKAQIEDSFKHHTMNLRERGEGESIYWHFMSRLAKILQAIDIDKIPEVLHEHRRVPMDVYYGNFSLFQSLPDVWAIDQVLPVVPIHRLDERPMERAILSDITCDCDGKLDTFLNQSELGFPVHKLKKDEEYYLGVFLVGAYQETLGDLHNLLGDTHVVTIEITDQDEYNIVGQIEGDSVQDVLSYVEYDSIKLSERFNHFVDKSVQSGAVSIDESRIIKKAYQVGLEGYTYFERN